ncbi:MAG: glycosyltransferase [Chloroflexota bacterium]|nr:glycosyltransferase [Dehalococcoidia bacterium]MDW8254640.1 glycosyltransferase [Chloroflexota bacterium]
MAAIRSVSVVIANLNCPVLDQGLAALCRQQLPAEIAVETIVVGRDAPNCLQRFPWVRFIETDRPLWPAAARNRGIREASGELIASLDADCVPSPHWIAALVAAHETHGERVVVGGGICVESANLWALADNLASFNRYLPSRPAGPVVQVPAANLSARRALFEEIGPFDERLRIGEDTDWTMRARRAGVRLLFEPRAVVWHNTMRRSPAAVIAHGYEWGYHAARNRTRYALELGTPWVLRHWWATAAAAPLIATATTAAIYLRNPGAIRYIKAAPIVWLAKLAWCVGAARRLAGGACSSN